LDAALQDLPDANLALISVPGAYARLEAMRALRRGLDVFLFSDNVPIEDEVALKRFAIERGLLCMGPDCGTAYVGGVGLGFANVVPSGRVGCVSASGTGLQAVASRLAHHHEGISFGIGVGGRDLQRDVGGLMTWEGIRILAADASTEAIVVISKPADSATHDRLHELLAGAGRPAVVCSLGARGREADDVRWVETLEDAADAIVARLRGTSWTPSPFADPDLVRRKLAAIQSQGRGDGGSLLGLFAGGTLAQQAESIIGSLVDALTPAAGVTSEWEILDLGADEYTLGRPHPMFDPEQQGERIRSAGRSPDVGVILLDVVLGHGAHPDPADSLAGAIEDCRTAAAANGRAIVVVAAVVGTAQDPQGIDGQVARLEAAGATVFTSSAEAARFAAAAMQPGLAPSLLGAT
jgi:succinyl-CoA synthetase alpha subunit